jgi:hypothetical protein
MGYLRLVAGAIGDLPRLRTTLLGEAQVGAGQSVEARISTLTEM